MHSGHYLSTPFCPISGENEVAQVSVQTLSRRRREWKRMVLIVTNFRIYYQSPTPPNVSDNLDKQFITLFSNLHQTILLFAVQKVEVRKSDVWETVFSIGKNDHTMSNVDNINAIRITSINDIVTVAVDIRQNTSLSKFCRLMLPHLPHSKYVSSAANSYYPTPVCLDSSIYCDFSEYNCDEEEDWNDFLARCGAMDDHEVHRMNERFKCGTLPKLNIRHKRMLDANSNDIFSRNRPYQHFRFIRWHYKLPESGSLYCCSGTAVKCTKETTKDWTNLLGQICRMLDENGLASKKFDLPLYYDDIQTDLNSPLIHFFENCRNAQVKSELDERFLHFYSKSRLPYLVCDMLEKAFHTVDSLSVNRFLILVETNNNELSEPGGDWIPCLSSLVQIIAERRNRTINGLLSIIEREWVQSGHDFVARGLDLHNYSLPWLVFVECLYQLVISSRREFSFDENIFKFLLHSTIFGVFSQFSFHNIRDRTHKVQQSKISTAESLPSFFAFLKRMEENRLFNGFDEDCSEAEQLDFAFYICGQSNLTKRIPKVKNEDYSSPKRLMRRISRGLHVGKVKHRRRLDDQEILTGTSFAPYNIRPSNAFISMFIKFVGYDETYNIKNFNQSKNKSDQSFKNCGRKIIGFHHLNDLNSVLWNDERGLKFLRKSSHTRRMSATSSTL